MTVHPTSNPTSSPPPCPYFNPIHPILVAGKRKAVSPKGGVPKNFRHESESEEEDGIQKESMSPPEVNQNPNTQSIKLFYKTLWKN